MNLYLFFAFLSAAIFGFMNVFDTYIVKKKVKNVIGFAIVSAVTNVLFGVILALFLDWGNYSISDYFFPILAGLFMGIQLCFYYIVLSKHDVSSIVGLVYFYPLIVALLSFLFLGEKLSFLGYVGMIVTIFGVLSLSLRIRKLKLTFAIGSILVVILTAGLNEFFVKIAVSNVSPWNGTAINSIVMGLFVIPLLLRKSIRKGFFKEFKNFKLTLISEFLTLGGMFAIYSAMVGLEATIVSVITAVQPLFVLFFEWAAFYLGFKIVKDIHFKHKLFSIVLIIVGIVLLYISDVF